MNNFKTFYRWDDNIKIKTKEGKFVTEKELNQEEEDNNLSITPKKLVKKNENNKRTTKRK